jgi:hypothetical protein
MKPPQAWMFGKFNANTCGVWDLSDGEQRA